MKLKISLLLLSIIDCVNIFGMEQQQSAKKTIELTVFRQTQQLIRSAPIRYAKTYAETFVSTIELSESAEAQLIAPQSFLDNSSINADDEDGPESDSETLLVDEEDNFGDFERVFSFDDLDDCEPGMPPFLVDKSDIGLPKALGNKV